MKFYIEKITPEMAIEYLKHNNVNRNISPHTVRKYADDMKNGMFRIRYEDENNNFKYGWIENGDAEFID